jgi:hypothetical protein
VFRKCETAHFFGAASDDPNGDGGSMHLLHRAAIASVRTVLL